MKVLLHACCGPCLLEPFDALSAEHYVEVAYANPNIHPPAEYERRRDVLVTHAESERIPVRELEYDADEWSRAIAGHEDDPGRRCRECFGLRMRMVAEEAARSGFDAIATTLTVSPYQDPDSVMRAGHEAAERVGLRYLHRDFRPKYPEATRRSRELGMYRQNYCGCFLSEKEAAEARRRHRESRASNREAD